MKWIVLVLILLNVVLLSYFKVMQADQAPTPRPPPLHPEKIKLLSPQDIAALPNKDVVPAIAETGAAAIDASGAQAAMQTSPALGCYEWGSFSARNLPKARNILANFSLTAGITSTAMTSTTMTSTIVQQTPQASTRYWVYIPKRASAQAAQAKIDELRALNIDDIFVVQEPQWRYAISLGVFKDEQLANKRLADVKSRGVISAVKAVRNQEQGQSSFIINNMSPQTAAELEKLKPDFPGSEIKPITCQ